MEKIDNIEVQRLGSLMEGESMRGFIHETGRYLSGRDSKYKLSQAKANISGRIFIKLCINNYSNLFRL